MSRKTGPIVLGVAMVVLLGGFGIYKVLNPDIDYLTEAMRIEVSLQQSSPTGLEPGNVRASPGERAFYTSYLARDAKAKDLKESKVPTMLRDYMRDMYDHDPAFAFCRSHKFDLRVVVRDEIGEAAFNFDVGPGAKVKF